MVGLNLLLQLVDFLTHIVDLSEVADDFDEVQILFLHLLVVAATLFGLPRSDEQLHRLEDLVCPSHVAIHKMFVVYLQKPMILLVLLMRPVPSVDVLNLLSCTFAPFGCSGTQLLALQLMLELLPPVFE